MYVSAAGGTLRDWQMSALSWEQIATFLMKNKDTICKTKYSGYLIGTERREIKEKINIVCSDGEVTEDHPHNQ
jgi:hypothetical protein